VQPTPGSDERKDLKAQIAAYNGAVVNAMSPLSELVKQPPSSSQSGVQEYGPLDLPVPKPAATFRLTINKIRAQKYGWQLRAKPIGADDSLYKNVLVGSLENAVNAHRGAGVAGFSLNNLNAANPAAYPAKGQLTVTSAAGPKGQNSLVGRLVGFSADGKAPPINAVYAGDRTSDGTHHIRWQMNSERVGGMPDKGPEQIVDYVTWRPDKGSRIYTVVSSRPAASGMSSGDLPANTYLIGQSCYAKDSALLYKAWNRCEAMPPAQCLGTPPILIETPGKTTSDCTVDSASPPLATPMLLAGPTATAPIIPPLLPESIPAGSP